MTGNPLETVALVWLEHFVLIFLRIGAMFFLLPILGSTNVPAPVRLLLALACSFMLLPLVSDPEQYSRSLPDFVASGAAEVFIGLLIGFSVRTVFWMAELAASMAAQAVSLSQILGNQLEQPQPAMGQIMNVATIALACTLNFHVYVVVAMARSYEVLPVGKPVPEQIAYALSLEAAATMFRVAFGMAAPFLIIGLIYNICIGIVNKAMPQLMVAFVGAPAITWIGLVVFMLAAPVMLQVWARHLLNLPVLSGSP